MQFLIYVTLDVGSSFPKVNVFLLHLTYEQELLVVNIFSPYLERMAPRENFNMYLHMSLIGKQIFEPRFKLLSYINKVSILNLGCNVLGQFATSTK